MKEDMMKMDLGMFFDYFRSDEVLTSLSFEQMIKHYNDYKITNKKLKELKEDYYVSQVEAKLNNPNTEWEDDQNEYVINYKKELEYHLKMVKEPMDNLLKKIEKIDKEYDIKLEKYDKQFDIVSKLKIEIDAKNEVKTGYENILKNLENSNIINNENNDNNNKLNNTEGILGSIKSFFTTDNSENAKIQKKIKDINKILEEKIKNLNYNEKILDKYKNELEKSRNEQNLLKQQLLNMEKNSNKTKKDLLKNLSEKLKLSAKFVATSKY
jgi:chromosome segregation ATPase